jgi:acetyl esterase/lipase
MDETEHRPRGGAVPDATRVTIEDGVVVGTAGPRPGADAVPSEPRLLRADVFRPPAHLGDPPRRGWPAILLVHGGAWQTGDRSQLRGYGILFARAGYLAVACEYRLSPEARWPEHLHDVKATLRWMRANAADLRLDPDRLVISGNSAGGHLALVAAGTPDVPDLEGDGGHPGVGTAVAACIAIYPPTKLYGENPEADIRPVELITDQPSDEIARQASPVTWAGPGFPPTLLVHGGADAVVPVASSLVMYDALSRAGVSVDLHIYADQPHAFDAGRRYGLRTADEILFFLERYVPGEPAGAGGDGDRPAVPLTSGA